MTDQLNIFDDRLLGTARRATIEADLADMRANRPITFLTEPEVPPEIPLPQAALAPGS